MLVFIIAELLKTLLKHKSLRLRRTMKLRQIRLEKAFADPFARSGASNETCVHDRGLPDDDE